MIEHHAGCGSKSGTGTHCDELTGHDLVGASFEEGAIFGSFPQFPDEWGDVFEEVPIGDDPDAGAVVAVDDEVVVVGLLEDRLDGFNGVIHRDGLNGVGHDIVDDEGVHG